MRIIIPSKQRPQKTTPVNFERQWMFSMNTLKLLFRVDKAHIISPSFTHGTLCRVKNSLQQNLSLLGIRQTAFSVMMFSALDKTCKRQKHQETNLVYLVKKLSVQFYCNTLSSFLTNPLFELCLRWSISLNCFALDSALYTSSAHWTQRGKLAVGEPVVLLIWTSCSQMRTESHFKEMASGSKVML